MNKHILCVMDRANKTEEELRANYAYAANAADDAYAADDVAYAAYAAYANAAAVEYWLDEYFNVTGESREAYEKALKDGEG